MKKTCRLVFLFFLLSSCYNKTNLQHAILFYSRDYIRDNYNEICYEDVIAITNYSNKSVSIKQFYKMAVDYIDTVSTDKPVISVLFIGQSPHGSLPPINNDDEDAFFERRRLFIIAFRFNRDSLNNKTNFKSFTMELWHNEETRSFDYNKSTAIFLDSILSSDQLYDCTIPFKYIHKKPKQ